MSVAGCIKAVPISSLITWLVISPAPCQIRNDSNPIILMHMHDTLARTGWIGLLAPLVYSSTYVKCTFWFQQGFRGLPVLDYKVRSSTELSEEASITEADHMIWLFFSTAVL